MNGNIKRKPVYIKNAGVWLALLYGYLFFEYVRPQSLMLFLGYVRPALLISVGLIFIAMIKSYRVFLYCLFSNLEAFVQGHLKVFAFVVGSGSNTHPEPVSPSPSG